MANIRIHNIQAAKGRENRSAEIRKKVIDNPKPKGYMPWQVSSTAFRAHFSFECLPFVLVIMTLNSKATNGAVTREFGEISIKLVEALLERNYCNWFRHITFSALCLTYSRYIVLFLFMLLGPLLPCGDKLKKARYRILDFIQVGGFSEGCLIEPGQFVEFCTCDIKGMIR